MIGLDHNDVSTVVGRCLAFLFHHFQRFLHVDHLIVYAHGVPMAVERSALTHLFRRFHDGIKEHFSLV